MKRTRRRFAGALGAIALALGLMVVNASPASAFTTPKYQMNCYTYTGGSFGNYKGYARCYTPAAAKWKVRVSCKYGGTYDSIVVYTSQGWKTLSPSTSCYWGVNWVQVIEL